MIFSDDRTYLELLLSILALHLAIHKLLLTILCHHWLSVHVDHSRVLHHLLLLHCGLLHHLLLLLSFNIVHAWLWVAHITGSFGTWCRRSGWRSIVSSHCIRLLDFLCTNCLSWLGLRRYGISSVVLLKLLVWLITHFY